ncbi:tenascin-like [Argopecten irradians]|uniref:tenascin-like n=1 Tax=Argopecten irradians TaxID=31199 RepID=UPI003717C2F3
MKAALIIAACAMIITTFYTVTTEHVACTDDTNCTSDCPHHGHLQTENKCINGYCHCITDHTCDDASDCICDAGFTGDCHHGHCTCHH